METKLKKPCVKTTTLVNRIVKELTNAGFQKAQQYPKFIQFEYNWMIRRTPKGIQWVSFSTFIGIISKKKISNTLNLNFYLNTDLSKPGSLNHFVTRHTFKPSPMPLKQKVKKPTKKLPGKKISETSSPKP
jgi:hypothetical protein